LRDLIIVVPEVPSLRLIVGKSSHGPPDSQLILETDAVLANLIALVVPLQMLRMRGLVLIASRKRILIEVTSRIARTTAIDGSDVVRLSLDPADEFLEILVDIIGGAIAKQLVDLIDALQQIGSDVPIEKLEVKFIEGLHR
jgi:hypothetical protein